MPPLYSTAFAIGDHVFVRNYGVNRKVKWLPGRITSSLSTRVFTVKCTDGIHRRHIDQMRHRVKTSPAPVPPLVEELRLPTYLRAASPPRSPTRETPMIEVSLTAAGDARIVSPPRDMGASPVLRRSARNCRPRTRYSPLVSCSRQNSCERWCLTNNVNAFVTPQSLAYYNYVSKLFQILFETVGGELLVFDSLNAAL